MCSKTFFLPPRLSQFFAPSEQVVMGDHHSLFNILLLILEAFFRGLFVAISRRTSIQLSEESHLANRET